MTIHESNHLLRNIKTTQSQLLDCLENLCKEYGYIQGMISANFRDLDSGHQALSEIQLLIKQLKCKIKCS
jgi:hypothetical protein